MKGTRPLTNEEIRKVRDAFDGVYVQRNRGLFMIGVSIGGRVSELLALTVGDVWQNGRAVSDLQFDKNIVKGKETARTIPVNTDGRKAIEDLIAWHRQHFNDGLYLPMLADEQPVADIDPGRPLFPSQKGLALNRQAVHKILEKAFVAAGLNGKLATHTLRKTFAQRLYQQCNDIYMVKELLGHKNIATTQAYIGINYVTAQDAVEAMSLEAEDNPRRPLEDTAAVDLINELLMRGYTVASLDREPDTERGA